MLRFEISGDSQIDEEDLVEITYCPNDNVAGAALTIFGSGKKEMGKMSLIKRGLLFVVVLSIASTAQAGFFEFGFVNNDSASLTMSTTSNSYTLDFDPAIPGHGAPRGFGSTYFGAGLTHDFGPSILWNGSPTDVGIVITNIVHDGLAVSSGFSVATGELGGFDDVFVNQIPPSSRVGLNTPLLYLTHDMIHEAQTGDPMDPAYENHAHIYFEAEQQGVWDVTFVLRDLGGSPIYGDSAAFTVQFNAVPEPASLGLLAMTACGLVHVRRRKKLVRLI